MTAQNKTTIKSYFETGDRPTQAQFANLIDSYQDINSNLTTLASASIGAFGTSMLATATTAAAQNLINIQSTTVSAANVDYSPNIVQQVSAVDTVQEGIDQSFFTVPDGSVLCPQKGLVCKQVSNTTVDIDATNVVLYNTAGYGRKFTNINLTVDITVSGANGLDTGVEANTTWYHLWIIATQTGTVSGLLSASSSAPTLPATYVFKGYVGAVYNNGSGNFAPFYQNGNQVGMNTSTFALSNGTQTAATSVSLAAFMPPTATSVFLQPAVNISTGSNTAFIQVQSASAASYGSFYARRPTGVTDTVDYTMPCSLVISTPQTIFYFVNGSNARGNIEVMGFVY